MRGTSDYFYRLWEVGQDHLGAGRYVAARSLLERAANVAWRAGDARSLARVYLPLLEVRRQIRLRAVEGTILIGGRGGRSALMARDLRRLAEESDGTMILPLEGHVMRAVPSIAAAARRAGKCVEVLVVMRRGREAWMASPVAPMLGAGVGVHFTREAGAVVPVSTAGDSVFPLPPGGRYAGGEGGLGALARESLLIAWEALGLRWQARHALRREAGPWEELEWLREALGVDPASEPITMRLIAVAEGIERRGS